MRGDSVPIVITVPFSFSERGHFQLQTVNWARLWGQDSISSQLSQ